MLFVLSQSLQEFELLFRRFRPGLVHFASNIVHNAQDAEEIVHDMFLAVWEKKENLLLDDSLKNYLFTGVKNRCLNHIKKSRILFNDLDDNHAIPSPDADIISKINAMETEKRIHFLIDLLPPKCKTVFLLSRIHEFSYKEIAEILDLAPKTVENQIGIALKFLKEEMSRAVN